MHHTVLCRVVRALIHPEKGKELGKELGKDRAGKGASCFLLMELEKGTLTLGTLLEFWGKGNKLRAAKAACFHTSCSRSWWAMHFPRAS